MNLLKRFFLWIVKIVCGLAFLIGVLVAIFEPEYRTAAIIGGVIALIIGLSAAKAGDKAEADSKNKCKKCKSSLSGAAYSYRVLYSKATRDGSLYKVPVDIDVTCPNCGKVRYLPEYIYIDEFNDDKARKEVEYLMDLYSI